MIRIGGNLGCDHATLRPMPALTEDTAALMSLIKGNDTLVDDCFRITAQALERFPPTGNESKGVGGVAASARSELSGLLQNVLQYCDDTAVQEHLVGAHVDWRDVAREFIADVLCSDNG
jgi:hypothetical protein